MAGVVAASAVRLCAVFNTQRDQVVHLAPSSTVSLGPILLSPADSTLPHYFKPNSRFILLVKSLGFIQLSTNTHIYLSVFFSYGPYIMDVNVPANSLFSSLIIGTEKPMEFCVLSLSALLVLLVTFQSINYHVPYILIRGLKVKIISTAEHV